MEWMRQHSLILGQKLINGMDKTKSPRTTIHCSMELTREVYALSNQSSFSSFSLSGLIALDY